MKRVRFMWVVISLLALQGCVSYGPAPETVPAVDVDRYVGLWHEIASNPVFFNRNLVGVTAEYAKLNDTQISVLNTGYKNSIAPENKDTIQGTATVVPGTNNSKLKVQFAMFLGCLFKGNYWIVLLDEADYQYAVVTDNRQFTMFILCREPFMDQSLYNDILERLKAKNIDTTRLKVTGEIR